MSPSSYHSLNLSKIAEAINLKEFSLSTPEISPFPSHSHFEEVVNSLSKVTKPSGFDSTDLYSLADGFSDMLLWSDLSSGRNAQIVLGDTLGCDLNAIHPARLFLMREYLNRSHSSAQVLDAKRDSIFCFKLDLFVSHALKLIDTIFERRFSSLVQSVRKNQHSRLELLNALDYPVVDSDCFTSFFCTILGENSFHFDADVPARNSPAYRPACFHNVSSRPVWLIQALVDPKAPKSGRFVDLGCGSGAAMFTVALLTDLEISGIEIESHWCMFGKNLASSISRDDIKIIQGDLVSPQMSLPEADIFYCYSPFRLPGIGMPELFQKIELGLKNKESELWVGPYKWMLKYCQDSDKLAAPIRIGNITVYESIRADLST